MSHGVGLGAVPTPNSNDVGRCDEAGTCTFSFYELTPPYFVPPPCMVCELQDAIDVPGMTAEEVCAAVGIEAIEPTCFDDPFYSEFGAQWAALEAAVLATCGGSSSTLERVSNCEFDGTYFEGTASYPLSSCDTWNTVTTSGTPVAALLDIEPSTSSLTLTLPGGASAATPLGGRLFAAAQPARFAAGIAAGLSTEVEGVWYDDVRFGFIADLQVGWSNGQINLPSGQLGGVWWEARRRSDGQTLVFDLSPSEDATGVVDLAAGTWSLTYVEVVGQYAVTVALAGPVRLESTP